MDAKGEAVIPSTNLEADLVSQLRLVCEGDCDRTMRFLAALLLDPTAALDQSGIRLSKADRRRIRETGACRSSSYAEAARKLVMGQIDLPSGIRLRLAK